MEFAMRKLKIVATHNLKVGQKCIEWQDCHCGTDDETLPLEKFLNQFDQDSRDYPTFDGGDNFDLKCTANRNVKYLTRKRIDFRLRYLLFSVSCNHGGLPEEIGEVIIINVQDAQGSTIYRIAILHPDCFDYERWSKYRAKSNGMGWLKRNTWLRLKEKYENFNHKIKDEVLIAANEIAEQLNVNVVQGGHYHTDQVLRLKKGRELRLFGRGRREFIL